MGLIEKIFGTHSEREIKRVLPIVDKIEALEPEYEKLSDDALKAKTPEFKNRLKNGETLDDILVKPMLLCERQPRGQLGRGTTEFS